MLRTIIRKNQYMDSVALMLLTRRISALPGMQRATVMMGTPANKEILEGSGYTSPEIGAAGANDMVVCFESSGEEDKEAEVLAAVDAAQQGPAGGEAGGTPVVDTWAEVRALEQANLCLLSVPGQYAAEEAEAALEMGKHAFVFSDNVTLEEECRIKRLAHEKGLLVMGPDCGTGIIGGVPLAFANVVKRGNIGIVAASGTGLQEVCCSIQRLGGGITHAIGVGGRDLSAAVGAITTQDALAAMVQDEETKVLVVVSKPPAPEIAAQVLSLLKGSGKPSVVLFMGDAPRPQEGALHFAYTLEEAARTAVALAGLQVVEEAPCLPAAMAGQPVVKGLFSGGTLAYEAAMLLAEGLGLAGFGKGTDGKILESGPLSIWDLGDDVFTQGRPHPMIDASVRVQMLEALSEVEEPLVVLLDVVLGYGASKDPAGDLADAIATLLEKRRAAGRDTAVAANLVGTSGDPQHLAAQREKLEQAGASVCHSNQQLAAHALALLGRPLVFPALQPGPCVEACVPPPPPKPVRQLLDSAPQVVNIGVRGFADDLTLAGAKVTHFNWKPVAGGDKTLRRALAYLDGYRFPSGPYRSIDEANQAVIDKVRASTPFLVDVVPAKTAAPELEGRVLLHAGPPILWQNMTSPMQGSCVGAALFEGWANTEEEAWALLQNGGVVFKPCHHAGFVGPMGGITSGNMPVLKVVNQTGGNTAYCTMNEGIGPVLRFGAYSPDVIDRLRFMRDTLAPTLSAALALTENGLNVNVMVGKAIAMGDEFHQRNIAGSLVFLKEVAPLIAELELDTTARRQVMRFLADTDQFFLNIMMASAKAVMDDAATITEGTVVTVMSRNGEHFGVRLAGMGAEWFTAPVNTPDGLYFSGYSSDDANPDMGDSAITETFGVGGMAMIAAPAVTRFVGSGGFHDALATSNRMKKICISQNGSFPVPTWDFQGICLGIDARLVAETGITPVINTGIAHRQAGKGQIGAGTVSPPVDCFSKAIVAYAEKLGFSR